MNQLPLSARDARLHRSALCGLIISNCGVFAILLVPIRFFVVMMGTPEGEDHKAAALINAWSCLAMTASATPSAVRFLFNAYYAAKVTAYCFLITILTLAGVWWSLACKPPPADDINLLSPLFDGAYFLAISAISMIIYVWPLYPDGPARPASTTASDCSASPPRQDTASTRLDETDVENE